MQYRILSTLTVLGAPGVLPSTLINQRSTHHATEIERGSCLVRGCGAPRCRSSQQTGTAGEGRSRGHLKSTTGQDAEVFPCSLLESCLYTNTALHMYVNTPHHSGATALPWQETQNPGVDHAIASPKSTRTVDTCLKGQTQEGLLSCSFQYGCLLPPLQRDCGRESCRLCFRVTFLI